MAVKRRLPSPILAALHDTDYRRMSGAALDRLAEIEPPEDTARWLASLPDDLADAPWYTIARRLEGRVWELEESNAAETV